MSTPGEQERVRRLLGDLAHTEQVDPPAVPPEVAARLDAALAAAAEPSPDAAPAPVVPLRRRVAPWLAAAAAAVVVGGLGTAALTSGTGDQAGSEAGGASSSTADEGAEEGADASAAEQPSATAPRDGDEPREPSPSSESSESAPSEGSGGSGGPGRLVEMPALSTGTLAADTERLLAAGEVAGADDPTTDAVERDRLQGSGCVVPDPARGAATFVALDGDPAVLVVGPADGDERPVAALACADGSTVARAQVPADAAGR